MEIFSQEITIFFQQSEKILAATNLSVVAMWNSCDTKFDNTEYGMISTRNIKVVP